MAPVKNSVSQTFRLVHKPTFFPYFEMIKFLFYFFLFSNFGHRRLIHFCCKNLLNMEASFKDTNETQIDEDDEVSKQIWKKICVLICHDVLDQEWRMSNL